MCEKWPEKQQEELNTRLQSCCPHTLAGRPWEDAYKSATFTIQTSAAQNQTAAALCIGKRVMPNFDLRYTQFCLHREIRNISKSFKINK